MMRKTVCILAVAALSAIQAFAQTTSEGWQKRYEKQASAVGLSGVGVETILDRWALVDSTSAPYLQARYAFWYDKSHSVKVEANDNPKYLGQQPLFNLTDSTKTKKVYYYQVDCFDDALFGKSLQYLDKAIAVEPTNLNYRTWKVSGLMLYERESPDMTLQTILSLIDEDRREKMKWTYNGKDVDAEFFDGLIQEFCYNLYTIGSDQSRKAFLEVSEKMLSYDRNAVDFIANEGSYYMTVKEYKKALKYFDKVLKLDPDNATAIQNCNTIARILKDDKLKKKYQPMLVRLQEQKLQGQQQ